MHVQTKNDYQLGSLYIRPKIIYESSATINEGHTTVLTDAKTGHQNPILTVRQDLSVVSLNLFGIRTNCNESFTTTDKADLFVVLDNDQFRTPGLDHYRKYFATKSSLKRYSEHKF